MALLGGKCMAGGTRRREPGPQVAWELVLSISSWKSSASGFWGEGWEAGVSGLSLLPWATAQHG